jgi:hypothetical protein
MPAVGAVGDVQSHRQDETVAQEVLRHDGRLLTYTSLHILPFMNFQLKLNVLFLQCGKV